MSSSDFNLGRDGLPCPTIRTRSYLIGGEVWSCGFLFVSCTPARLARAEHSISTSLSYVRALGHVRTAQPQQGLGSHPDPGARQTSATQVYHTGNLVYDFEEASAAGRQAGEHHRIERFKLRIQSRRLLPARVSAASNAAPIIPVL
jgi:hypothetical protein